MCWSEVDRMHADGRGARDAASDTGGLVPDLTIKERRLIAIDSPGMARGLVRSQHENGKDRVLRLRSENILE